MAVEGYVEICGQGLRHVTLTPMKAIRLKCLDCSAGSHTEIRLCVINTCPLHPYRFGKNPTLKGVGRGGGFKKKEDGAASE